MTEEQDADRAIAATLAFIRQSRLADSDALQQKKWHHIDGTNTYNNYGGDVVDVGNLNSDEFKDLISFN